MNLGLDRIHGPCEGLDWWPSSPMRWSRPLFEISSPAVHEAAALLVVYRLARVYLSEAEQCSRLQILVPSSVALLLLTCQGLTGTKWKEKRQFSPLFVFPLTSPRLFCSSPSFVCALSCPSFRGDLERRRFQLGKQENSPSHMGTSKNRTSQTIGACRAAG